MLPLSCPRVAISLLLIAAFGLCVGSNSAAFAQAPAYYTVTEIQPFDPNPRHSTVGAAAINASGQVVGTANKPRAGDNNHNTAFLWDNGVMTDLGAGMETSSSARDINASGQVVGYYGWPISPFHAVWWHDGTYTDLHPLLLESGAFGPIGPPEQVSSFAIKINDAGQIMGFITYGNNETLGFIYHNGVVTAIPRPGVATWPQFISMNNLGQVTGYFPVDQAGTTANTFVWHNGVMSILTQPEGWPTSNAWDINDAGQIVGLLHNGAGPNHGFLYADGEFTDLGLVYPDAISNSGAIVGAFQTGSPNHPYHGFIYTGGQLRDINDLVPVSFSQSAPFQLEQCVNISDQGQILCQGTHRVWIDGYGSRSIGRHVVLTPAVDTVAPQVHTYDPYAVATSAEGAVVDFGFYVQDDFDRSPSVTYSTPPGSLFPVGTTTVTATVVDDSGNATARNFQVTVEDTPPDLTLPEPIFTDATSASGAAVNYVASAHDIIDGDRPVSCTPASGATFPVGETVISCSSTDTKGHTRTGEFQIFVLSSGQEATPTGYVEIPPPTDSGLGITFDEVASPGVTTIEQIDAATIGTPPEGFVVTDLAFKIDTTADFTSSGYGASLTFVLPLAQDGSFMSEADFSLLTVLHYVEGQPEPEVLAPYHSDYATRTIKIYTYSFSPFYIAKQSPHKVEKLYDHRTAYKAGSAVPVKLRVRSTLTGANLSSSTLAVTARSVKRIDGGAAVNVTDAGAANADGNFRYLGEKDGGSYIFNLSTKGLQAGRYALSFYVGADRSFFHTVEFEVR